MPQLKYKISNYNLYEQEVMALKYSEAVAITSFIKLQNIFALFKPTFKLIIYTYLTEI